MKYCYSLLTCCKFSPRKEEPLLAGYTWEIKEQDFLRQLKNKNKEIQDQSNLVNQARKIIKEQNQEISHLKSRKENTKIILSKISSCYRVKGCLHDNCDFKQMSNRLNEVKKNHHILSRECEESLNNVYAINKKLEKQMKDTKIKLKQYQKAYDEQKRNIETLNEIIAGNDRTIEYLKKQMYFFKNKSDSLEKEVEGMKNDISFLENHIEKKRKLKSF